MANMRASARRQAAGTTPCSRSRGRARATGVLWIGFLALWLAAASPAGAQAAPRDVPSGHWARSAVINVLERGLMGTLDDNAFRGDQPVTRYDLAVILDRLLQQSPQAGTPLEGADLAVLRDLVESFRADLVAYYQSRDELVRQVRLTHETIDIYSDTLNLVLRSLDRLEEERDKQERQLQASINAMTARLEELTEKVAQLEAENRRLTERLAALEARVPGPRAQWEPGAAPEPVPGTDAEPEPEPEAGDVER